jgi:hypothetical protein
VKSASSVGASTAPQAVRIRIGIARMPR